MAHNFQVVIEKEGVAPIEIGKDHDEKIRKVIVRLDTLQDDSLDKSGSMLSKIEIRGDINDEINEKLLSIFDWAKDFNKKTTYRKVTIKIIEEELLLRTYEIDNVFVVDYFEEYVNEAGDDKGGNFILKLSQKENELKTAKTFAG